MQILLKIIPIVSIIIIFSGSFTKLVHAQENSSLYFLHTDHLNSTIAITDRQGNLIDQRRYTPFGSTQPLSSSLPTTRLYTAKEIDRTTNLYNYNVRLYYQKIGQFISADPKIDSKSPSNRFSFVANNPLRFLDLTGNRAEEPDVGTTLPEIPYPPNKTPPADFDSLIEEIRHYGATHPTKRPYRQYQVYSLYPLEEETISWLNFLNLLPREFQEAIEQTKFIYFPQLPQETGSGALHFAPSNIIVLSEFNPRSILHEAAHRYFYTHQTEFLNFIKAAQQSGFQQLDGPLSVKPFAASDLEYKLNLTGPDMSSHIYGFPYHLADWVELSAISIEEYVLNYQYFASYAPLRPLFRYIRSHFFKGKPGLGWEFNPEGARRLELFE